METRSHYRLALLRSRSRCRNLYLNLPDISSKLLDVEIVAKYRKGTWRAIPLRRWHLP